MKEKLICQGAEAKISLLNDNIIKHRLKKSYRIPFLDTKLRKSRTKSEIKIIKKLSKIIPVPEIIDSDLNNYKITMQHIKGKKLSVELEKLNHKAIAKMIAENISLMHEADIIHGDLTTSNMIYSQGKIFFIDFGLSFHSNKLEDKAVDLHLIEQALSAKHHKIADICFQIILQNYKTHKSKQTIERLKAIEKRGRYKGKH